MMPINLTNASYLVYLLKLGRTLHRDFSLQVTITPPSAPSLTGPSVAFQAVKWADFEALPQTSCCDEWCEDFYSSVDKIAQLWVGFYHMIEERGESRMFGTNYANCQSLYDKVRSLYTDYISGRPVSIYLSDLFAADEFYVTSPGNTLADAIERLRSIAYDEGYKVHQATNKDVNTQPGHMDIIEAVDFSGNGIRIWESRHGIYHVKRAVPEPPVDSGVREALLHYLRAIQSSMPTSAGLDERRLHEFKDCYLWDISVTDVIEYTSTLSPGAPPFHNAALAVGAVAHYRNLAAAAWYYTWTRVAAILPHLGIVSEDLYLRFLNDYLGPDIATHIAAVGSATVPQRQVLHISYSAFSTTQSADDDSVSFAIPPSVLRDVGRLGADDNIVRPPLMTRLDPLVITTSPSGLMIATAHSPSLVKKGRLTDVQIG